MMTTRTKPEGRKAPVPEVNLDSVTTEPDARRSGMERLSLEYWEDWATRAASQANDPTPAAPSIPTYNQYLTETDQAKRDAWDSERIRWMENLPKFPTPAMEQFQRTLFRLGRQNQRAEYGRRGILVTGPPTVGKTTLLAEVGLAYWHRTTRNPRNIPPARHIPVACVSVPSGGTPKQLDQTLLDFFGMARSRTANATALTEQIVKTIKACGTEVIMLDEAHNLDARRSGQGPSDHLKELANKLPVTMVLSGVNILSQPIWAGERGNQTAGRFIAIEPQAFRYETAADQTEWASVVATFEEHLLLYKHPKGHLAQKLAGYLYARTQGRISTLSGLFRDAAEEAIYSGEEQITYDMLETILTDELSQRAWEHKTHAAVRNTYKKKHGGKNAA